MLTVDLHCEVNYSNGIVSSPYWERVILNGKYFGQNVDDLQIISPRICTRLTVPHLLLP
jgi:hypothetical protein